MNTTAKRMKKFRWMMLTGAVAIAAGAILWNAGCGSGPYSAQTRSAPPGYAAPPMAMESNGRIASNPFVLPTDGTELWVIASRDTGGSRHAGVSRDQLNLVDLMGDFGSDSFAGTVIPPEDLVDPCGGIVGYVPRAEGPPTLVAVPLEHTDVRASITAYIASVDVKQRFHNPYDGKIEAVYVFPLPQDAAVTDFLMTIGDRTIRGIIREREEAERIYEQAKSQGYVASLMTQERPNIFTQKVANIEPGKRIDVDITYFHTLAYDDGWYEFVFPMVVGPRFNRPGSTDSVEALPRGANTNRPGTNVTYLAPKERSGHDIALTCEIDAGVGIEEVKCASHVIESRAMDSSRTTVALSHRDSIPNKDFVLRYRVAGDRVRAAMLTHRDPSRFRGAGHFTLVIHPPDELKSIPRQPLEFVFVLDCSGSMSGRPLDIAKAAAERVLKQLKPEDTFQIVRFSDSASALGRAPIAATDDNVERGLRYLRSLDSEGGTMMIEGIKAALDFPHDSMERQRYVVFLTDGYIGNEAEVLGEMRKRIRPEEDALTPTLSRGERRQSARVFSVGIGSSVNRYLLDQMASLGEGVSAFVGLNDGVTEIMDRFVARVAHPALENITIDYGGLMVEDVFPSEAPDLFAGRPVVLAGRFRAPGTGDGHATVHVRGVAGSREVAIPIEVNVEDASSNHEAIASVWARMRITQLTSLMIAGGTPAPPGNHVTASDLQGEVLAVALEYGMMSAYTAFIAVDSSRVTAGEFGTTVDVPVPVPDGVRYETTVGDDR